MSQEANYFRIGLFVVIAATILAIALIVFGAGRIFERRLFFETYVMGSVQGIERGAAVKFRGVSIGQVSNVTFVFNEYPVLEDESTSSSPSYNFVMVVMEVTKSVFPGMFDGDLDLHQAVQNAVAKGLRARIEPIGITGMNYIELDFLNPKEFPALEISWKPRDYYIPSAPGQLTSILDSINRIMRDVQTLQLGELGDNLTSLLKNLNNAVEGANVTELSSEARTLMKTMNSAIEAADVQAVSRDLKALINRLDVVLKESDIQQLSASTRLALDEMAGAVANLQRILKNIEPATQINSDDVNTTLSNMRIITDNLRVLSGDLRRHPSRLIWGGPPARVDVFEENVENQPGPVRGKKAP